MSTTTFVAGGYGCGTTHVYRIVRAIYDELELSYYGRGVSQAVLDDERLLDTPARYVLKTHDALVPRRPGLRVIMCTRNIFDAAASHVRRTHVAAMLNGVRQRARLEKYYAGRDDVYEINYDALYADPVRKVVICCELLACPLTPGQVDKIAEATGVERTSEFVAGLKDADSDSELRPGHVGPSLGQPGAGIHLNEELRRKIEAAYVENSL